jgi:oxygen-independent coproporphyrinogen-3 oxidase
MPAGVYIHIPFCKSRCSYCDFATDVFRSDEAVERYVRAVIKETEVRSRKSEVRSQEDQPLVDHHSSPITHSSSPVAHLSSLITHLSSLITHHSSLPSDTIYFGGGTPSLLSAHQLERIINAIRDTHEIAEDAEITVEMNPATVSIDQLRDFRSLGVNRASFGVQTFDDRSLKLLARGHDAEDARNTFELLRKAGFGNVSFDLIAGLPHQTLEGWEKNLIEAIAMSPEHISLYLLEIHQATPLAEQVRSGRQPLPDEDLAAEMYDLMLERLEAAGYEQYEISNFSKAGRESRHNLKYWELDPVIGYGVSAHSFDGTDRRWSNVRDTKAYVSAVELGDSPVVEDTILDAKQLMAEFAFLKLRLNKGLDLGEFEDRFGVSVSQELRPELERLAEFGLVEINEENRLKLTMKGMVYSNEVFEIFI